VNLYAPLLIGPQFKHYSATWNSNGPRLRHALRGVEHLDPDEVSRRIVNRESRRVCPHRSGYGAGFQQQRQRIGLGGRKWLSWAVPIFFLSLWERAGERACWTHTSIPIALTRLAPLATSPEGRGFFIAPSPSGRGLGEGLPIKRHSAGDQYHFFCNDAQLAVNWA